MSWYDSLEKVSIVGMMCSLIITVVSFILFCLELKNPKNSYKLIKETSLEKYAKIMLIGTALTMVFGVIEIFVKATL